MSKMKEFEEDMMEDFEKFLKDHQDMPIETFVEILSYHYPKVFVGLVLGVLTEKSQQREN